ncbi:MAG: antibiotic transport system permease protein [Chloroflexi bacterium]|nr:MAG: antibiotic transport system permease protein [Chloroflexota bacterium]
MRKLFLIALKDLKLAFRDRAALTLMLLAPFALTIGMGLITGRFSGNTNTGLSDIPLVLVNEDGGSLGNALVEMMQSKDLESLLEPQVMTDLPAAYALVDEDKTAAVIYIPAGFSDSVIPASGQSTPEEPVQIELYLNPTRPNSVGVIKTILEQFMSQVEVGRIGGQVVVTQLLTSGAIDISQAEAVGRSMGEKQANEAGQSSSIKLNRVTNSGEEVKFDILAYLAPGMALMFLMFTVSYGGRSMLVEQAAGTLPRMLTSPTTTAQVLGGKVFGIFLTGAAQMLILIFGTTLLFRLDWGAPFAVFVLVLAAALGATGWGIFLTALLKTPGQASAIGSAVMLIFGILGGSFINVEMMPDWIQFISRITPNRWGLDGFTTLALGGGFANILTPIIGLLAMAAILFVISVVIFSRRGIGRL